MNKLNMRRSKKKDNFSSALLIGMMAIALSVIGCGDSKNPMSEDLALEPAAKKGGAAVQGGGGETAYSTNAGSGEIVGYNETDCPDYGIMEYTLWAGKTNDAGTVSITNSDETLYVTYNTNGTADLQEVHVYIWDSEGEIPERRPAPGRAPYTAENLYVDTYTLEIPMDWQELPCGEVLYISTHAALVADGTEGDDEDDGTSESNEGETAYAGGSNTPDGFASAKGAWWGYVSFEVTCFYDISGTVYRDADNSGDLEEGESGFDGVEVSLLDGDGNVVETTSTDASGDYLFEHVPAGSAYSVAVDEGPADHVANENADGFTIAELDACEDSVDFGYVPVYDISGTVYSDSGCDSAFGGADSGLAGVLVTLLDEQGVGVASTTTGANGVYLFEDVLGGSAYRVEVETPADYTASENGGGFQTGILSADLIDLNFGFCPPTIDPCEVDPTAEGCGGGGGDDDFPTWGQAISHIILVFTIESCPNCGATDNDGYYTIKVDEWNDSGDQDLDNEIADILGALEGEGLITAGAYDLLGSSIKGGTQITSFYAYGSHNENGEEADTPPEGIGFTYNGTKDNEGNQSAIDVVIDRSVLGLD